MWDSFFTKKFFASHLGSKGPSTHGEEFVNEKSTNTQRILDEEFFFAGDEFLTLILNNFSLFCESKSTSL